MPGGSHNRKSSAAVAFHTAYKDKEVVCKCPLHRNGGAGRVLSSSEFNRQEDAHQCMCARGKTLIDAFSHKLNRVGLIYLADPTVLTDLETKLANPFPHIKMKLSTQVLSVATEVNNFRTSPSITTFLLALNWLELVLRSKLVGLYDVELTQAEFEAAVEILESVITTDRIKAAFLLQSTYLAGAFLVEDSKDHQKHPFECFHFNISKKRELYNLDGTPAYGDFKGEKLHLRANVHNTLSKSIVNAGDRVVTYLSDGDHRAANTIMSLINLANGNGKKDEGDHLVPLRLGGIHDPKNLRPLDKIANIKKKDKLTDEALDALANDVSLLSSYVQAVYVANKEEDKLVLGAKLKEAVDKYRRDIHDMPSPDRLKHLSARYPALSTLDLTELEARFLRHYATKPPLI